MDILVYDGQNPKRQAWRMTEEGFKELAGKYPGRYFTKEAPKIVKVEKKSPVVVQSPVIRVTPPVKKSKGKS